MQPVIGLTCSQETDKYYFYRYYGEAVLAAGGLPVFLPVVTSGKQIIEDYGELIDGLLLTGGGDISPHYYGEEPVEGLGKVTPERDWFELQLCREIMFRSKPVLGICRGLQVLNVAAGGSLFQDLPTQKGQVLEHNQSGPRWHPSHQVFLEKGSRLASIIQEDLLQVNSFHHQGVKLVAPPLTVAARALDGVIEALEEAGDSGFLLGVQWHPERMWERDPLQQRIFQAFLQEATKITKGKRNSS